MCKGGLGSCYGGRGVIHLSRKIIINHDFSWYCCLEQRHSAIVASGVEVRGSSYGFPSTQNKVKGKASEGRVVAEVGGKISTSGVKDTTNPDLLEYETGDSCEVGSPTAFFKCMFKGDGI